MLLSKGMLHIGVMNFWLLLNWYFTCPDIERKDEMHPKLRYLIENKYQAYAL